jgi:hypothetical protein
MAWWAMVAKMCYFNGMYLRKIRQNMRDWRSLMPFFRVCAVPNVSFLQKMRLDTVFMRQWGCRPACFYEIWFWDDTV